MIERRSRGVLPILGIVGLLALLVLLTTLQYRWIGLVSRAEGERMRANLESAGRKLAEDLDREITRVFLHFQLAPAAAEGALARRALEWMEDAPYPRLVAGVFLAGREETGAATLRRLDETTGTAAAVDWPPEFEALRRLLTAAPPARGVGGAPGFSPPLLLDQIPAVVVRRGRPAARRFGGAPGAEAAVAELVLIQLDLDYLKRELLPTLVGRHFGPPGELEYELAVVRAADPADVVYRSPPEAEEAWTSSDIDLGLFALRPFPELRFFARRLGAARWSRFFPGRGGRPGPPPAAGPGEPFAPRWRLLVRHRAGSLEAAVLRVRRRNLGLGLAILLLLGASLVQFVRSTRRAQRLARQQLDFVAGVSHELHTPLAAILSAGQNLADGVVEGPEQVRRYGSMIATEGRRLSEMVRKVMQFAGTRSESRPVRHRPVDLLPSIHQAASDCRWILDESACRLELDLADDLPAVAGDPEALRQALVNLIENAAKHGGAGGWVGVRAAGAAGGARPEVAIAVEDRGPGLDPDDLPHLFEPFYRGAGAARGGARGSGLGLSLVRQFAEEHGGRVTARNRRDGPGAIFTLYLPAGPAAGGETGEEAEP